MIRDITLGQYYPTDSVIHRLDPRGRDEILGLISQLHEKRHITCVLVSHSMEDVARYVERIIVMNRGEVMYDGTPKEVFSHYRELEEIGLAAPQVGVLKQIVVMDVDDGNQYVLINPEIIEQSGSQTGQEGCLSVPGKAGMVTRPNHVVVRAYDENMEQFELEGEELLARCICHECAHLHGQLYVDLVEGELMDTTVEPEEE